MHVFMFVLGWLMLTAALLCLGWQIWCAGRWLYRWLHPWNEAVDAKAREYLVKPHPLWTGGSLPRWGELKGKTIEIQELSSPTTAATPTLAAGRPPTTARATKALSSDAQGVGSIIPPIPLSWRLGQPTTPTIPAGQHSPFAVMQDVLPDGEKTPVSDAPETG